jgi:cell division protein FtsQ
MPPIVTHKSRTSRPSQPAPAESEQAGDPSAPTRRPRRVERLPRFALVMAALLAIAAFPQSALFALDRVEITGDTQLTEDAVLAIAGIRRGDRLFAIDAAGSVRRLRASPRIKSADLWLRPPHAILVRVVERRPIIALVSGDRFAWLGDDLVVVQLAGDPAGLPVVVDRIGSMPWSRVGAPVASVGAKIALGVMPAMPASLRQDLQRIEVTVGPDITLELQSGLEIRVGGPALASERLAQVPDIIAALRARGVTPISLDLRYAGSVAVRLAPAGDVR